MKKEMFEELVQSIKEAGKIARGEMKPSRQFAFKEIHIQKIRLRYGLSQGKFAALLGISVSTLRNWEQGRRKPDGPARVLLRVAAKHPKVLLDTINQ